LFDLELAGTAPGSAVGLLAFDPAGEIASRNSFSPPPETQHAVIDLTSRISGIDTNLQDSNDRVLASLEDILGDLQKLDMPVLVLWLDPSDLEITDSQGRFVRTKEGLIDQVSGDGVYGQANGRTELMIFANPGGMFALQLVGLGEPLRGMATYINGSDVRSTALQGFLARDETLSVFLDFVDVPRALAEVATLAVPESSPVAQPEAVPNRAITLAMNLPSDTQVVSSRIIDGRVSWVSAFIRQLWKRLKELMPDVTLEQTAELLLRSLIVKQRRGPDARDVVGLTAVSGADIETLIAQLLEQASVSQSDLPNRAAVGANEEPQAKPTSGSADEAAIDRAIAETGGWIDEAAGSQAVRVQRNEEEPAVTQ
jgi:hypothetical protein